VFSGQRSVDAVRVPAGADLVLEEVELSTLHAERTAPFVFASALRIAEQEASSWLGHEASMPRAGRFKVERESVLAIRQAQSFDRLSLSVDVICVHTVNLQAPVEDD
jgi:hypothetical protein